MHEDEDDPFEVEFEDDNFDPERTLSMVQVRTKSKSCITKLQATPINKVLMALRCTNILNALLVILVFPIGLLLEAFSLHISTAFFAGYTIMFAFIIFCFGGYAMFALTMLNAGANAFVLAVHPAFKPGGGLSPYDDPVVALTGTTFSQHVVGKTKEFLKSNPEVMHEASNVGLELMRATVLEPKETVD